MYYYYESIVIIIIIYLFIIIIINIIIIIIIRQLQVKVMYSKTWLLEDGEECGSTKLSLLRTALNR